jgi:hypothetical protein
VELNKLHIESSPKTPQVDFDPSTGELVLEGRSIPENAAKIYENLLNWVNLYKKHPRKRTNFRINLEYFNTASTLWLAKMVQSLSSIKNSNCTLIIHLYFNIEDFETMMDGNLQDEIHPLIHLIDNTEISIGVKIYGTGANGQIIKECMILI